MERGIETIGKNLDREIKKGKLAEGEKAAVLGRVVCVTDMGGDWGGGFCGGGGAGEVGDQEGGVDGGGWDFATRGDFG